jgi:hypothetical protein
MKNNPNDDIYDAMGIGCMLFSAPFFIVVAVVTFLMIFT